MNRISRHQQRMEGTTFSLIATATAAAAIALPATARADSYSFQSPSGNIDCLMGTIVNGGNYVFCEIADHTWVNPPRSPDCPIHWGDRLRLGQGSAAVFACYGQPLPPPEQTLDFGQTRSVGAITCDSEPSGMTCTDSSTGHFFRVSRDSYQLG